MHGVVVMHLVDCVWKKKKVAMHDGAVAVVGMTSVIQTINK
jgi:hypothetical protein